jgi:hypothetical protein
MRDVLSIGLETRHSVSTKRSVKIQHLRSCDDDSPMRPIKTKCLFVAEIPAGAETKELKAPPVNKRGLLAALVLRDKRELFKVGSDRSPDAEGRLRWTTMIGDAKNCVWCCAVCEK